MENKGITLLPTASPIPLAPARGGHPASTCSGAACPFSRAGRRFGPRGAEAPAAPRPSCRRSRSAVALRPPARAASIRGARRLRSPPSCRRSAMRSLFQACYHHRRLASFPRAAEAASPVRAYCWKQFEGLCCCA